MCMFVGQRSPISELRSSSRGRRIFARVGGVVCVAEALDGHFEVPVDCLAEPMCQTRAGESGRSVADQTISLVVRCSPAANSAAVGSDANMQLARTHRVDSNSRPINFGI